MCSNYLSCLSIRHLQYSGSRKSELCPMPYALCPMPYALCPTVPHLSEKGYICVTAYCQLR
ncbi:MAG: hypothetical protein WBL95_00040 [Microcoleus sp.]